MTQTIAAYKQKYECFGCFNPECRSGLNLQVHHIVPVAKGGKDEFENYIILCQNCHIGAGNHSRWRQRSTILWTYKFYIESKWGESLNADLPELPISDSKPEENDQRNGHSEILQSKMPSDVPQPAKNETADQVVPKRTEPASEEISNIRMRKCWWCGKEFNGLERRSWCCSDPCKANFSADPENSFYHRGAKILATGRQAKWTALGLIKRLDSDYSWLVRNLPDSKNDAALQQLIYHLQQALTILKNIEP
jgi:hypothetical protein